MPTPGTYEALKDAKTIGSANLAAWGQGFNTADYLDVLPHSDTKLSMNSGWTQWQKGNRKHLNGKYSSESGNGSYYSSWGPAKTLNLTLKMSTLDQQTIQGLGRVMANKDGGEFNSVYDTSFWQYNKQIAGPLLVANPGDTINIKLVNDLTVEPQIEAENPHAYKTNLHGHGLHVSPGGNSDNVLLALKPGESWDVSWKLSKNHMSGLDWSHPHYHGATSLSIAKGLALPLVTLPKSSEAAGAYDPTKEDIFLLNLQTWSLAQQDRPASPTDPLNQDPTGKSWPIGTPPKKFTDSEGDYYKYSPARFNGNNYYPINQYNPANPKTYGDAVGLMPNENVVHTVNGYYNPTLETQTGKWVTFLLENFSLNSTHLIQLIRRDENGQLSIESTNLLGTDSDLSHWVSPEEIDQFPLLMPGGRVGVQHAFSKPGDYFLISNASKEVLGDLAPTLSNVPSGNGSTYLGFNDGFQITPSQVLATVHVSGNEISEVPPQPKPWHSLYNQYSKSQALRASVAQNGVDKERTFDWLSSTPTGVEFNNPETWEKTWTINGQYWSHAADQQPTLTTTMLDTVERWTVRNLSAGRSWDNLSKTEKYNGVGQSHPFHIHTNEFLIESINGLNVSSDPSANQVGDSFYSTYLDNLLLGPRYTKGTATADNPYGMPGSAGTSDEPFAANLLLEFKDFPGLFVDHCHLLFHEDAGMMVAVQTILNTDSSWLVSEGAANKGTVQLSLASDVAHAIQFSPYQSTGQSRTRTSINVSSGDINADSSKFISGKNGNTLNVTDNIADIATLQGSMSSSSDRFLVKIYDGAALKRSWARAKTTTPTPLWTIDAFKGYNYTSKDTTDLAVGDVNGDGYADIVTSIGGGDKTGIIDVYSGANRKLLARLTPFADSKDKTSLNLAIGDVNADGYADIVTGQGNGGSGCVEVFSGLNLSQQIKSSGGDVVTGLKASDMAKLFTDMFQPYGSDYRGSVDVAAGYTLPRGYLANQVHQTPSANITTLKVGASGSTTDPTIRNFIYVGGDHGEGDHQSHSSAGHDTTPSSSVTYTSGYNTSTRYSSLATQYIDLPTGERGQSTILATTNSGRQDLLYLPDTSLQSGVMNTFDSTVFNWNPASLG